MKRVIVLLTLWCLAATNKVRGPADVITEFVISQTNELRDSISRREWQVAKRSQGVDTALVLEYRRICDEIDKAEKAMSPKLQKSILTPHWAWAEIETDAFVIRGLYSMFRQIQEKPDALINSESWKSLARAVLQGQLPKSITTSLKDLHAQITDSDEFHESIFHLISKETEDNFCNSQQSPQLHLYNVYNFLRLIQIKAYTLTQFSWMLLQIYDEGNFTRQSQDSKRDFIVHMAFQAEKALAAMGKSKRDMWQCDPRSQIPEETYTEITKLLQGYIINEVDLNGDGTCKENCPYYKMAKQHGCYGNNYCAKQRTCRGKLISCTFVDSDMWICPSEGASRRRYEWIEYENGRTLGQKKSCSRAITKVDSWWRWLFWHCSYCMCLCDDPVSSGSDRYFNLRSTSSDKASNRVITGLKFVKSKGVIHMQIQQGQMLPKGAINESTIEWKNVDDYYPKNARDGEDYHTLKWERRAIDLDELKAPPGMVLTAVRFRMLGGHLNFEIEASNFDFTTGKLINSGERSMWISNDNTDGSMTKPRTKLDLGRSNIPTRTRQRSEPDSKPDQYLEFTNSDMDWDASQSTVPFIDIQPVVVDPPVPLSGAGIYHKGVKSYGGFIAPKLFTLNYQTYIENPINFPEINAMLRI